MQMKLFASPIQIGILIDLCLNLLNLLISIVDQCYNRCINQGVKYVWQKPILNA